MTHTYIQLTSAQAININDILYRNIVTTDGITFKAPFGSTTTQYINQGDAAYAYCVDDNMQTVATYSTTVSSFTATAITSASAQNAGLLPPSSASFII